MTILLKLSPILPDNAFQYIMGMTSIGFSDFALGLFIGISPEILIQAYIGVNLQSIEEISTGDELISAWEPIIIAISVVLILITSVLVVKYCKQELNLLIEEEKKRHR